MWKALRAIYHAVSAVSTATWLWGLPWAAFAAVIGGYWASVEGLPPPLIGLVAVGFAVVIYGAYVFYRLHRGPPWKRPNPSPAVRWAPNGPAAFSDEFDYLAKTDRLGRGRRDTPLGEAIAYLALGRWGAPFGAAMTNEPNKTASALTDFHQAAHDGDLTVWGKQLQHGVFEKVPTDHWAKHGVNIMDLAAGDERTRWIDIHGSDHVTFSSLMVSRAEFERWRNDR